MILSGGNCKKKKKRLLWAFNTVLPESGAGSRLSEFNGLIHSQGWNTEDSITAYAMNLDLKKHADAADTPKSA